MDAKTIQHVNAMPAPTWHRLHMNDTDVEIPAGLSVVHEVKTEIPAELRGASGAFDAALAAEQVEWEKTHPEKTPEQRAEEERLRTEEEKTTYGGTAYSRYQIGADAIEEARSLARAFETGMGADAYAWMREVAGEPIVVAAPAGDPQTAAVRVAAVPDAINVAAVDVVAAPNAEVTVIVTVDSPKAGTGVTGTSLRVFAGAGARVHVVRTQTDDATFIDMDDAGLFTAENAFIDVRQTVLGAAKAYTGLAGDIRGTASRIDIDTRYLGHHEQLRDFNYTLRHHGEKTLCNITANGVLSGTSKKTYRGTIDLVRGCKGAVGQETETVLLADDGVVNQTVPVILCNEDDVVGNHGATIGHVRPEQMFYLASRGLSQEAAENMFVRAIMEQAAIDAPDEPSRDGVMRLGANLLDNFEGFLDEEEA